MRGKTDRSARAVEGKEEVMRLPCSPPFTDMVEETTWIGCGPVIMAAQSAPQLGRFHLKCSRNVHLSEDGKNAWIKYGFGIVFSKEPIPRGRQFSVKVLEPGAFPSFSSSVVS